MRRWMFAENQAEGIFGDSFTISLAGLPTDGAAGLPGHWECLVGRRFPECLQIQNLSICPLKMYVLFYTGLNVRILQKSELTP